MEQLIEHQNYLLKNTSLEFTRNFHKQIDWSDRMIAIKGARGVGKTTILLQYIKQNFKDNMHEVLYISLDHYWFYNHILVEVVHDFYKNGGKYLFLDEVHKYPNWSRELKNIYDMFRDMKVVFTASSALDIYRGEADLSRRVVTYEMSGLSFREYLIFTNALKKDVFKLEDILENNSKISSDIANEVKILPLFKEYLKIGYFPYFKEAKESTFYLKLNQTLSAVLESDLSYINGHSAQTAFKIKKFLAVLSESVPYKPNIADLARKLDVSRDMIYDWFSLLENAKLLNLINIKPRGFAYLQKPDKVYLENTNIAYAMLREPNIGNIRETFFMNQLKNAGFDLTLPPKGDFTVNNKWVFEVGGKDKTIKQIKAMENGFVISDNIEVGFGNKIPLWLFGFLY